MEPGQKEKREKGKQKGGGGEEKESSHSSLMAANSKDSNRCSNGAFMQSSLRTPNKMMAMQKKGEGKTRHAGTFIN